MVCHITAVPNSFDHGTRILVELVNTRVRTYTCTYPAAAAVGAAAAGAAGAGAASWACWRVRVKRPPGPTTCVRANAAQQRLHFST
jgi:hypothetical protein